MSNQNLSVMRRKVRRLIWIGVGLIGFEGTCMYGLLYIGSYFLAAFFAVLLGLTVLGFITAVGTYQVLADHDKSA